ncbi:hypothetical protein, partial [Corallococcus sicarius]|uniref:hypothetical protein n=1 Tax=Corallococcus sicarius TaxID=2316726 RepID=UPI0011C3892F
MKQPNRQQVFGRGVALACAALALLLGAPDAEAATAQRLCFRNVSGVPGVPGAPTIDGDIDNDLGWTGAFRYEFGNGVNQPHAVVQGNRDASNVYLSFEVNNDSAFEDEDVLVLTFDTGTSPNRYRRLHLYPLFAGAGAAANNRMREAQLWKSDTLDGSGKVVWGTVTIVPHSTLTAGFWLDAKVRSTDGGVGNRSWNVELKIPNVAGLSGIKFPPASDFKMFLDVFRVDGLVASTPLLQWPGNAPAPENFIELESATPPVASWGAGSFGTGGCGGVTFAWNDINTNNVPTSLIHLTNPNTFNVTLHNSSVDDSGAPIPAKNIRATLKIANFGLPAFGSWTPVPAANNPTPSLDVPASGTATLSAGPWTLTPAQVTAYSDPSTEHQCVLAELDSGDPRTLFTNRSAWRNMDFGIASTFERVAEIGTKGYKLPREYKAHRIDVVAETDFRLIERGDNEKGPQSELTWAFHGYRHLGRYVVINKKKFEVVEPVGSFGYIIRHRLEPGAPIPDPVSTWQLHVKGIELNPLVREQQQYPKVRYYQADIVDGEALQIATVADYPEKPVTGPGDGGTGDGGTGGPGDGGTGNPPPVDGCGCRRSSPGGALGL